MLHHRDECCVLCHNDTTPFVIALQFTSVSNTVIFRNTPLILLLLGKMFAGHHVMAMELI
jgi:hypothetical protein